MARAAVLLAEGFEEIEAITIIDVLRRADVETVIVGVTGALVRGNHGIGVSTDQPIASARGRWDLMVLPGGMPGAATLRDDARVQAAIRAQKEAGGPIAAICAAPIALARAGVLSGKRATCYPSFADQLGGGVTYVEEEVVIDGDVITSRGPGTALPFALALVRLLTGPDKAASVAGKMLVRAS